MWGGSRLRLRSITTGLGPCNYLVGLGCRVARLSPWTSQYFPQDLHDRHPFRFEAKLVTEYHCLPYRDDNV